MNLGQLRPIVLIADDDVSIRRMLRVWLRNEGYESMEACDGGEALEVMRSGRVGLVLLDLMMPDVTGWQVLSERAKAPELRAIPVIVITAGRGEKVTNIARDSFCTLLPKPFEFDRLRAVMKTCLGHKPAPES